MLEHPRIPKKGSSNHIGAVKRGNGLLIIDDETSVIFVGHPVNLRESETIQTTAVT